MIYRSNLTCPDLTSHFKHLSVRPMPHSFGHDVPSDWADKAVDDPVFGLYKNCGMWTHDEAAILYNVARETNGQWLDVGSHTGWTTRHIMAGTLHLVHMVDPMYGLPEFTDRMYDNVFRSADPKWLGSAQCFGSIPCGIPSDVFWEHFTDFGLDEAGNRVCPNTFAGICIDGDHEPGAPLQDAMNAAKHLADTGVIIFHDFIGAPVREGVRYLMELGFHCRVFQTPHMIGLCWRGDFVPPDHVPDPQLVEQLKPHIAAMTDFPFERCE